MEWLTLAAACAAMADCAIMAEAIVWVVQYGDAKGARVFVPLCELVVRLEGKWAWVGFL